jgi:putative endonuclease
LKRNYHFYVYIMASRSRVLYIGMTNTIRGRVKQHKDGEIEGFSKRYRTDRLVYFESFQYVNNCIDREKKLKKWSRTKKMALIQRSNPTWEDLAAKW